MWDRKYYEGYEGEGEVKIWLEENGNETGIVVWDVFSIQYQRDVLAQNFTKTELWNAIITKMDFMMENGK